MIKTIYLLMFALMIVGCSSFVNFAEYHGSFDAYQEPAITSSDLSDEHSSRFKKLKQNNKVVSQDLLNEQKFYRYQSTIDSLYLELSEKESLIDSLIFEISKYKDNIIIKKVGFPKTIEFAGEVIDLTIERNLERFEKAYNSELKSAVTFIPRSGRYFSVMDSIFSQAGVPTDSKYLAIAESKLSYRAHSPMGADGIWQIMPSTGKYYDMEINDFIDERRDIFKATHVAARLLNDTYRYFSNKGAQDWLLAYCAYNAGMGNVNKVLNAQGGTKFTDLIFKTQETNEYVWKAIAIKYIIDNEEKIFAKRFDREPDILTTTKTKIVNLKGHYKLDEWAKAQGTNIGTVYELNPWIKMYSQSRKRSTAINDVVLPAGTHNILIPHEVSPNIEQVAKLEEQFLNTNAGYFTHHLVKSGDNLYDIALKYRTTINKIKQLNGMSSNLIKPGQKLKLYGNVSETGSGSYIVQKGDSISGISSKLNISQNTLISKNKLKKNSKGVILIYPGQKLYY